MEKKKQGGVPEITMEGLVKMVNESAGEFIIHVELGEERGSDAKRESVQP